MRKGDVRLSGRVMLGWVLAASVSAAMVAQDAAAPAPAVPDASAAPAAPVVAAVQGGTIRGTVMSVAATPKGAGVPLPGVVVTAVNTLTGKKYATATDVTGSFAMAIPRNGRYVLRAELAAFAVGTAEVVLNDASHDATTQIAMELASRVAVREQATSTAATSQASALGAAIGAAEDATVGGGGNAGVQLPSAGMDASLAGDSVSVNGQMGQTNGLAGISEDQLRTRIQDAMDQSRRMGGDASQQNGAAAGLLGGLMGGGGPMGPGGGGRGNRGGGGGGFGGGGGGRGGGFRGLQQGQLHGSLYYSAGNAVLDATQFPVRGPAFKPAYSTNRYGASLAGSPYLPGLTKPSTAQFVFLNYTGQRTSTPVNVISTVPTVAERGGDFSALATTANPTPIFDPSTGLQGTTIALPSAANCSAALPGSALAARCIAQRLLAYYPAPNLAGTTQNFQRIATQGNNTDQLAVRFIRNFGQQAHQMGGGFFGPGGRNTSRSLRQNINASFNYQHSAADQIGSFPSEDGHTSSQGYSLSAGYTVGYGRLNNQLSLQWNRSTSLTANNFTYGAVDPAFAVGLDTPNALPKPVPVTPGFYNGVPSLTLATYDSLNEVTPSNRVQQTISLNDQASWNHKLHNVRFGFNVRRAHYDQIGGNNVVGNFEFTGATTGDAFADLLAGAPQGSKIQAGQYKSYLREWVWDAFAQDDFRVLPNLTLNAGLRYEYFAPYTEKNNRLVNLDHNADFTATAAVQPGGMGPFTGRFGSSLINPDRLMFSPRVGLAWRPTFVKDIVVRAGYGINYNTAQYGVFATSLSQQPPFASTQNNTAGVAGCGTFAGGFTLASAFNCSTLAATNNFAINRNYRLGRVQVVDVGIQKTLPKQIVLNVDYNGSFGGNLDIKRTPNSSFNGTTTPGQTAILYEDSVAESRLHELVVSVRKRMEKGVSLQATYQYGHSIDNAASVGTEGANLAVQNDQRLDLEFSNSAFDVRHKVTGTFVYELPFGPNRAFLNQGGFWASALDGVNLSGDFTFATGTFLTPQFQTAAAEVASGGVYTLRPDRVAGQSIKGPGTLGAWFNPNAFLCGIEAAGATSCSSTVTGFGTASRYSIEGPGTVQFDMALSRTQKFGTGTKSLEVRASATNVLNTVQYSGINTFVDNPAFGQVTSAAAPRKITMLARYRF